MNDPRSDKLSPAQIEAINARVLASYAGYSHGGIGPDEYGRPLPLSPRPLVPLFRP